MSDGARDRKAPQAKGERRGAKAPGEAGAGLRENPVWRRLAVLGPGGAAVQAKAASGASDDPLEREADRAAARLVGPVLLREGSALRLQPLDAGAAPEPESSAPALLVEDDAVAVASGQMRKREFLDEVEREVCGAVGKELARAGRTTRECPYLEAVFLYYRDRSAGEADRALRRFDPALRDATSAREYIPSIVERARRAASRWVETGEIAGLPEGLPAPLRLAARLAAATLGRATALQRKSDGPGSPESADPAAVQSRLGPGQPLEAGARMRMESAFGADFSRVRAHTDPTASSLSRSLRARAFTVGEHVAFRDGEYRPGTPAGDALLAHELAHVVQQGSARFEAAAGLRLQRCGDEVDWSALAKTPDYDETVKELRLLYGRKDAMLRGQESLANLPDVEAQIARRIQDLRFLGVVLDEDRVYETVMQAGGPVDMRKVGGRISRTPPGPAFVGQRMTFTLYQDYLPPGRIVKLKWRWRDKAGKAYDVALGSGFPRGESITLDDFFWNIVRPREQFEVFAEVYLGDEKAPAATVYSGPIPLQEPQTGKLEIETAQKVAIQGAFVEFHIKAWSLLWEDYYLEWLVDGKVVEKDILVLRRRFDSTGRKKVAAKIYKVERGFWGTTRTFLQEASTELDVRTPATVGEEALAEAAKQQPAAGLADFEKSVRATMPEIAARVAMGGEQAEYWKKRYEAQEKRLKGIQEKVPYFKEAKPLPPDPTTLDPKEKYTAPVPAAIVYPEGGVQPITLYLAAESSGTEWSAKLVDVTGAKVFERTGSGSTPLAALTKAFETWADDNPYPRGGTVVYRFSPPGWTFKKSFTTDSFGKDVEAWVDGILMVGGIVVGALLLAAPEATITKVLGFALLGLSVARSTHAIFKNLEFGGELLDKENVIEGLSILTAFLGVGGSVMRTVGAEVRAVRPLVYRVGNAMVMTSLAADVGTLVYVTDDALAALRAVQGDPTLDEGAKAAQTLRVISGLLLSGALVFVTNRSLFKDLRASDFIKTRLPTSEDVSIGKATRLDIELEMRKAGADPKELRAMGDREILGAYLVMQRRQTAVKRLDAVRESLSDPAKAEFDAARLEHETPEAFAAALEKQGDPKKHFEDRAAAKKAEPKPAPGAAAPMGAPPTKLAEAKDRLLKLDPKSRVELAPESPLRATPGGVVEVAPESRLRINDQIDIHPDKLAEMPDGDVADLLKATRELAGAGGDFNKLSDPNKKALNRLASSGGQRLRFEHQRKQADALVKDLGLQDQPLFQNVSDFDRNRLYDLVGEQLPKGAEHLRSQAADYAMSRKPQSASEFVNHYQFYVAEFKERATAAMTAYEARVESEVKQFEAAEKRPAKPADRSRIAAQVQKDLGITGKVKDFFYAQTEKAMAEAAADLGKVSDTARKSVGDVYDVLAKAAEGRVGGQKIEAGLAADDAAKKVQGLGEVRFGSESAAAYHTKKHLGELPPSELGGKPFDAYLGSANKTIKSPTEPVVGKMTQDGSARSFVFTRTVTEGGKTYTLRAIVIVTSDGRVILATYMGG